MSVVTERCRECLYFCNNDCHFIVPTCDYFLITGKRRGCPAGDECDKFLPAKACIKIRCAQMGVLKIPVKEKQLWDLYQQGKNDAEIAIAVGINRHTVARWRKKNGLPSQQSIRRAASCHED